MKTLQDVMCKLHVEGCQFVLDYIQDNAHDILYPLEDGKSFEDSVEDTLKFIIDNITTDYYKHGGTFIFHGFGSYV